MHKILIVLAATLALSACSTTEQGAGIGAVTGGLLGAATTGTVAGAAVGAGVGAVAGGLIGSISDDPGYCRYRERGGRGRTYVAPCDDDRGYNYRYHGRNNRYD